MTDDRVLSGGNPPIDAATSSPHHDRSYDPRRALDDIFGNFEIGLAVDW